MEKLGQKIIEIKVIMGDFQEIIPIIRVIENNSREEIINLLEEKIKDLRNEYEATMDLIKLKQKNNENAKK